MVKSTLATAVVLGAFGNALLASAAPKATTAAQLSPNELDQELKAMGKAFQPFKNPKEVCMPRVIYSAA